MATIADHVSILKSLIKSQTSSEIPYTQSMLHSLFARSAALLQTRALEKGGHISAWNTPTFCIKLVESVVHDCPCITAGCRAMKSVVNIPRPLVLKTKDLIRVSTLDYREMHMINPGDRSHKLLDEVLADQNMFSIVNQKLIVWRTKKPTTVLVSGIWADVTDFEGIQACDAEGEELGVPCFDSFTSEFNLDPDLITATYNLCLEQLRIPLSLTLDDVNNASAQR